MGVLCWVLIDALEAEATTPKPASVILTLKAIFIINSLLYPFAKFFYDYLWGFIVGEREYAYSINFLTIPFIISMRIICWMFAFAIAPFGLIALYFENSKHANN